MEQIEIRFKRSPMHASEAAGRARVGESLSKTFGTLGPRVLRGIKNHTQVFVSNPAAETLVVKPEDWDGLILGKDDTVTLVAVPGSFWVWIAIAVLAVAVAIALQPDIPPPPGGDQGGALYSLGGNNNAELYAPIPAIYGIIRAPLKFIANPAGRVQLYGDPGRGVSGSVVSSIQQSDVVTTGTPAADNPGRHGGGYGKGDEIGEGGYTYDNGQFVSLKFDEAPGSDGDTDFIRILGTWGPGPLEVSDIRVGDVSIEDVAAQFQVYSGDRTTKPNLRLYSRTNRTEYLGRELAATDNPDDDWIEFTTLNDPTEARFDIAFPQGLRYARKDRAYETTVYFNYQWKDADSDDWGALRKYAIRRGTRNPFFASINIRLEDELPNGASVRLRRLGLPRKTHVDSTQIVRFESIRANDSPLELPPNYSVFEARIKADARTSGNLPPVTARIRRKVYNYANYNPGTGYGAVLEVTRNPAWIYLDALLGVNRFDEKIEARAQKEQIDWAAFKAWAIFCDQTRDSTVESNGEISTHPVGRFSRVIDEKKTVERTLKNISAAGFASPSMRGTLFSIFFEGQDRAAVGLLTPATTRKFKARRVWAEEIHGYRVSYADPENDYKGNQVIVYADGYGEPNGNIIKDLDGLVVGCDNRAAAWRFGRYKLAGIALHQETYQCEVSYESLFFESGDILNLSHDVIQVGQLFGRVDFGAPLTGQTIDANDAVTGMPLPAGDTGIILLDQGVPHDLFDNNRQRKIIVERAGGMVEGFVIPINATQTPASTLVTYFPDLDGKVSPEKFEQTALLTRGLAGQLDGAEYSIGPVDGIVTPVVVLGVTMLTERTARLSLRDFRGQQLIDSFVGDVPARNPVFDRSINFEADAPPPPVITDVYPGFVKAGREVDGSQVSDVFLLLEPLEIGSRTDIVELVLQWKLTTEQQWRQGAQPLHATPVLIDVPIGALYEIRAAFRNRQGRQGAFATTTRSNTAGNATTDAEGEAPAIVGLEIEEQGDDYEFLGRSVQFAWRDPARVPNAVETAGNLGVGVPDAGFNGYNILISKPDGTVLREDTTYEQRYEYSPLLRDFRITVARQDARRGASKGETIVVTNPYPAEPVVTTAVGPGRLEISIGREDGSPILERDYKETVVTVENINGGDFIERYRGIGNPIIINFDNHTAFNTAFFVRCDDWFGVNVNGTLSNAGIPPVESQQVITAGGDLVAIDLTPPPKAVGLVVSQAVTTTLVEFTDPRTLYSNHGHTEIWRVDGDNDLIDAEMIDTTIGRIYLDSGIEPGGSYKYWIRYQSAAGVTGQFDTTSGTTSTSLILSGQHIADLRADSLTVGRLISNQIDSNDFIAETVRANAHLTSPIVSAGDIYANNIYGGQIRGATLTGSRIIGTGEILGLCVPPTNSEGTDLGCLLENVQADVSQNGDPSVVPYFIRNGGTVTLNGDINNNTPLLPIHSSNYEDEDVLFRYRWPEVNPSATLFTSFYLATGRRSSATATFHIGITGTISLYQGDEAIWSIPLGSTSGNENNGFPNDGTNDGFEQNLSVGGNTFNIVGTFDLRQGYGFEMRGVTVNITLAEGHHFDFNNQGLLQARIEISALVFHFDTLGPGSVTEAEEEFLAQEVEQNNPSYSALDSVYRIWDIADNENRLT